MRLQLIRNATIKLNYAGKTFLIDPMLSSKGELMSFTGKEPNPTVDLKMQIHEITANTDCVLVTHVHPDHFDQKACVHLDKNMNVFCQPNDESFISHEGFINVTSIPDRIFWEGISIRRTGGKHGTGAVLSVLGEVSGFVLEAPEEPILYICGDSVWNDEVEAALIKFKPEVIITNSGGAKLPEFEDTLILMDEEQTLKITDLLPDSKIIAVHMEALDHCTVTRKSLRDYATERGIGFQKLLIPSDGEILCF
jgi:L-ascorbate metabolism protein UlaG (beta-lactamase superfamily)